MDLDRFLQALRRYRRLTFGGLAFAIVIAFLSYYSVSTDRFPPFKSRQSQIFASSVSLQIGQTGFPEGRASAVGQRAEALLADTNRLVGLTNLYVRLVNINSVRDRMRRQGPILGSIEAKAALTPEGDTLPILELRGFARSGERARDRVLRQTRAFVAYIAANQAATGIPKPQRVAISIVRGPTKPKVVVPRSKTMPILAFIGILATTIAAILVLENRRLRREQAEAAAAAGPEPTERPARKTRTRVGSAADRAAPEESGDAAAGQKIRTSARTARGSTLASAARPTASREKAVKADPDVASVPDTERTAVWRKTP